MQQLVFIHGGETFASYDEYLRALGSWTYEPSEVTPQRWKDTLWQELGDGWRVLMPQMPSKLNAKYAEWKIWFDKVVPHLQEGAVLVGHSLGGIFLAKHLNERALPIRVRGTMLIAAPFDEESESGSLADFALAAPLSRFAEQAGSVFLYHSEDDPVVPFGELQKYMDAVPGAHARTFKDRGHFLGPEFPELLQDIRSLAA